MIKVYFGNDESKKYIGESNTDSGAFRIIYDYVKNVIGWQKVYYRFWDEDAVSNSLWYSHRFESCDGYNPE